MCGCKKDEYCSSCGSNKNDKIGFIFYIQTEFCNANNLHEWLKNRNE